MSKSTSFLSKIIKEFLLYCSMMKKQNTFASILSIIISLIVLSASFYVLLGKAKAPLFFTGEKTEGLVIDIIYTRSSSIKGGGSNSKPLIQFNTESGKTIAFTFEGWEPPFKSTKIGEKITVIYDKNDPTKATVADLTSILLMPMLLIIPFLIILMLSIRSILKT